MSTDSLMDKDDVLFIHNGILPSHKEMKQCHLQDMDDLEIIK